MNLMIVETNSKRICNPVSYLQEKKKLMQVDFSGGKLGKDHANRPSNR